MGFSAPSENRIADGAGVPPGRLYSDNVTQPEGLFGGLTTCVVFGSGATTASKSGTDAGTALPDARLGRQSNSSCKAHSWAGMLAIDKSRTRLSANGTGSKVRYSRAIASYRVRHNKRCKVLVSQMSATVYYRLSADASLDYRRNGRSQSSPPAFSSNEIPFPVSASCYSAKLNLDAIALYGIAANDSHP